jgi:ABC-type antimicrobial peptide transport system permease subunit
VWLVVAGLTAGSFLSMWATDALQAVAPLPTGRVDISSIGVAATVLLVAGTAAVFPAARRAARMDPLAGLRGD